ncbi:MAG: copper chaperone PCu(A)C [Corynebacterium variabile]|uniref:copper chaperone PCu(A)C n=1 Tax=Corynebacterium variabile TaxID=1727 RepID=UPI0026499E4D|nr:copper chaperone PCu(A)C [Corynebacterium variabile]MDN6661387.1 copper chaperone PCu(A)C [Corynebacterium variabile]
MKTRKVATTVLRRTGALGVAAALALSLAACGDDDDTSRDTTGTSAVSDISAEGLSFTDGYVGAKTADTGMTAVFGVLTNTTDEDIHLTGVSGDLAGEYQYHEVVDGVMRETADGITVPAGDSFTLEPGGHHIMIMDSSEEIAAGDELNLTLTDDSGTTYELNGIPVRVQQSSHEDYGTDGDAGMDHGDHDMQ